MDVCPLCYDSYVVLQELQTMIVLKEGNMGTQMGDLLSRGNEMCTQGALTLFTERTWGF